MTIYPLNGYYKLDKYCDCLIENYINESSIFPSTIGASQWSNLTRTNAAKSFHAFFNQSFCNELLPSTMYKYYSWGSN